MHVDAPDRQPEVRDQQDFDEAVNRQGKILLEWLAGIGIFAALVMSIIALVQSGEHSGAGMMNRVASTSTTPAASAPAAIAPAATTISLKIIGGSKLGPDGKKHDVFTKTDFAVKVGQPLRLRIDNADDVPHSITAPVPGVNITVQPGTHTYTVLVKQAGRFQWFCIIPCDSDANGWAMQHAGFMSGYITAS
jgi:heme/copper-type cytochrome/quinol oxidase subunit 2